MTASSRPRGLPKLRRRLDLTGGLCLGHRLRLGAAAALVTCLLAISLGGCATTDAATLAVRACKLVTASLRLEHEAATAPRPEAARLRRRAVLGLERAEPLAAMASGEDTQWQALQATLSEVGSVPVQLLTQALQAQCAAVL